MPPLHKKISEIKNMKILQNCIGPTIRIGQEIQCLPYAGFLSTDCFLSLIHFWLFCKPSLIGQLLSQPQH